MAKLTAWLVTLIGTLMILGLLLPTIFSGTWAIWTIAISFLVIGIGKLVRNYKKK